MAQEKAKMETSAYHAVIVLSRLLHFGLSPILELIFAVRFRTLPWIHCLIPGLILNVLVLFRFDISLWKYLGLMKFYPSSVWVYWPYIATGAVSGFWGWGVGQTILKKKLIRRLSEAFLAAGLKTPLGRLPSFIFDRPIDAMTRKLRLKRQYLSLKQFKDAKETLESALQIYIDTVVENRVQGSIDILYSHFPMDELVTLGDGIRSLPRDTFIAGRSRSKEIRVNLSKTPHFLVGGQTGGGKSTFLRQMITTLYLNNRDYQFRLIDLKGGLEFQIFEKVDRIKVVPDVPKAIALIRALEKSHKFRMETLKLNGCKDIEAYFAKEKTERKTPEGQYQERISRTIIVIDEVADLFMANSEVKAKDVQEAKRIIWKVGAQGRAVGLHLVVATQRPDVKALDSQVKTHLVGVICFPMVNDASSMTVLGNGRATDLPRIPGRAIWKSDLDQVEIQTPFLKPEEVLELLSLKDADPEQTKGDATETSNETPGTSTVDVLMEVEGRDDHGARDEILSECETGKRTSEAP
ncbi:hypothetical protein BH10BDE1_BH10BDE1_27970 [soil metagenome]